MPRLVFLASFLFLSFFWAAQVQCQPERINYFSSGGEEWTAAALDPGDLLVQQSILLTNLYSAGNISFSLSFDKKNWAKYGLGPRYSSFFSLKNQAGCYCAVVTNFGAKGKVRKEYYLTRGRCYSIYWNQEENCWDLQENRCRR